jgi:excisionase family DNA binding protein
VIGNLNDYVKYQMGQGMAQGGGSAGAPAEMAVGFAMAQQMMRDLGAQQPAPQTIVPPPLPGTVPPVASGPEVLTPEQVAERLGVEVSDVLSAIESGELKGRKIGSQVRITQAALDDFLAH